MTAEQPSIQDIMCPALLPILMQYEIDSFVMGHHVYKESWTPFIGEDLGVKMQADNIVDRYAVAVFTGGENNVVGHLPLGKSGRFAKTVFYFLKANKENECKVVILGKAVNKNDGLGMKVPSRLIFTAEKKFIDILKQTLPKML